MQHELKIAERKLIAHCVKDEKGFSDVFSRFSANIFSIESHKVIFNTLFSMQQNSQTITADSLVDELELRDVLSKVGGRQFISELLTEEVIQLERYYSLIEKQRERKSRKELIKSANKMVRNPEISVEEIDAKILSGIAQYRNNNQSHIYRSDESVGNLLKKFAQFDDESMAVRMPWLSIDEKLGPLKPGNITLIGAGTGVGKSAFAGETARRMAIQGHRIGYWSGEMNTNELLHRMMLSNHHEQCDQIPDDPTEKYTRENLIRNLVYRLGDRLNINDEWDMSVQRLGAWFTSLKAGFPNDRWIFMVDYFHLLGTAERSLGEREVYMHNIRYLSSLAQALEAPILCLVQLGRPSEDRNPYSTPRISDIYGTSELEKTAHQILFLHQQNGKSNDERVVTIQKNRNGKSGDHVVMGFIPECTRFIDPKELESSEEKLSLAA